MASTDEESQLSAPATEPLPIHTADTNAISGDNVATKTPTLLDKLKSTAHVIFHVILFLALVCLYALATYAGAWLFTETLSIRHLERGEPMLVWPRTVWYILAPFASLLGTAGVFSAQCIKKESFPKRYYYAVISLFAMPTLFAAGLLLLPIFLFTCLLGTVIFGPMIGLIMGLQVLFTLAAHACGFAVVHDEEGKRLTGYVDVAKRTLKLMWEDKEQGQAKTGGVDDDAADGGAAVPVADAVDVAEAEKVLVDRSGTLVKASYEC